MSFSGSFMCTSFKKELLTGTHNFGTAGNTFRIALYSSGATLNATTTAYATAFEVSASGTYSAGGAALSNGGTVGDPSAVGTTAFTDFSDVSFTTATIEARGALIYNDTATGNPSVAVLDFGANKSSTAGTFSILFPTPTATGAIIRIA